MILAILLQAATPAAGADALALGQRIAETSTLAGMVPLIAAKEAEELIADHAELSDADKTTLRAIATDVATRDRAKLTGVMAQNYARRLSRADLAAIAAFGESEAGRHLKVVEPSVISDSARTLGEIDFKGDVIKTFCAKTGKACAPAK